MENPVASLIKSKFSELDKNAISITLRNEWEQRGQKVEPKELTIKILKQIVNQFKPLDPISKIDNALINFERKSTHVGAYMTVSRYYDYPYYYCQEPDELHAIINLAHEERLISANFSEYHQVDADGTMERGMEDFKITTAGYKRLREIQRPNQESNQAFVAMWFGDEVKGVFEDAIKPAIEYKGSPYRAIKIDLVEHLNDINDEIIAQIRRSRFMVCDLTGYRGGVYFEAGFAFGLGLPVIYTCRKDWTKLQPLKAAKGSKSKKVKILYDPNDKPIKVQKEGVHFDLLHRNRIEWDPNDLDDFKESLEKRIKANIF